MCCVLVLARPAKQLNSPNITVFKASNYSVISNWLDAVDLLRLVRHAVNVVTKLAPLEDAQVSIVGAHGQTSPVTDDGQAV